MRDCNTESASQSHESNQDTSMGGPPIQTLHPHSGTSRKPRDGLPVSRGECRNEAVVRSRLSTKESSWTVAETLTVSAEQSRFRPAQWINTVAEISVVWPRKASKGIQTTASASGWPTVAHWAGTGTPKLTSARSPSWRHPRGSRLFTNVTTDQSQDTSGVILQSSAIYSILLSIDSYYHRFLMLWLSCIDVTNQIISCCWYRPIGVSLMQEACNTLFMIWCHCEPMSVCALLTFHWMLMWSSTTNEIPRMPDLWLDDWVLTANEIEPEL